MSRPQVDRVSARELRRRFNDGGYWERAQAGELIQRIEYEGTPSHRASEPPGTRSQIIAYWDADGNKIAVVHQYLRPDGSLGGSGKPDPKLLLEGGVFYGLATDAPPTQ